MTATILLPAAFGLLLAEWRFLPSGDHGNPIRRDAKANEVGLDRVCAAIAKREVVLARSAFVAMALDREADRRPSLQPLGVLLKQRPGVVAHGGLVKIEEHVTEVPLFVELIDGLLREDLIV